MSRSQVLRLLAVAVPLLAIATAVVHVLETSLQLPNASVVYLVAVVASAIVSGTTGAIATAVASFVLYDYFFTEPTLTLTIRHPEEWLSLLLLLFVGIVVGELTALERSRAETIRSREREAQALYRLSRDLVTRTTTAEALPVIVGTLRSEARMARIWIALGRDEATEHLAADTDGGDRPNPPALYAVLRPGVGDEPAQWVRVHQAPGRPGRGDSQETFRVRIAAASGALGSLWCSRDRSLGEPDRTETRLLAAAADQIGQVILHDQLADEAQAAEIARQSDALKSALLQSVSHDLRTPLATIRAAAGTLRPGSGLSERDRQESADAIDREVEYLNRIVTNLLELSRIEAGALRAEREVFELDDIVGQTVDRLRGRLGSHRVDVDIDAPPVRVDPVLLDHSLTNILENAAKYTAADTPIRISARKIDDSPTVRLTVEDAGNGVPPDSLPRLFDKFYRVPGRQQSSRSGTGIGLAVVRGLIEATGGRVIARGSELGGLAIDLDLPGADVGSIPLPSGGAA